MAATEVAAKMDKKVRQKRKQNLKRILYRYFIKIAADFKVLFNILSYFS